MLKKALMRAFLLFSAEMLSKAQKLLLFTDVSKSSDS